MFAVPYDLAIAFKELDTVVRAFGFFDEKGDGCLDQP